MPRCPLCRSALVTITFGLYPIAFCTSCSARWIQDGHQQPTIAQVQAEQIEASFENGVLQIMVPKLEEAKPKRIRIRPGRAEILAASSEDTTPS